MARPLRIDYPHAFYHVTCRGNERREIFRDDSDRETFLQKLQTSLEIYQVRLHAYVLMSNHFHLIVQTPKANLSEFMRHFNISYTAYFNRRHHRSGHLYQGRFKAIVIEADSYLLELSRYVHLNPVRVGSFKRREHKDALRHLEKYRWSSLDGYLRRSKKRHWMTYDDVLNYVAGSGKEYAHFIKEGLAAGYSTPWDNLTGQTVLGEEGFYERLRQKWQPKTASSKEQPSARWLERLEPSEVLRQVAAYFTIKLEDLIKKRTRYRDERALAMELMHRYSRAKQKEIGEHLRGLDYALVSRERKRLREKIENEPKARKWWREIEQRLSTKIKI
jgi:REP element-mobilizing transposase RayT